MVVKLKFSSWASSGFVFLSSNFDVGMNMMCVCVCVCEFDFFI